MNKSTYIFTLLFLSANCFDLQPIGQLFALFNGVAGQFFLYLWLLYGLFVFKNKADHSLCIQKHLVPVFWILAGIFISMIPANIYYGQSFLTSIIAYRTQYLWIVIPILLYIKPTTRDIIIPLNIFSLLFVVLSLLRTYWMPYIFYYTEDQQISLLEHENEVLILSGLPLLLISYYYYVGKFKESANISNLVIVCLFLFAFLIIQNRSTLFIAVLIMGYAIIKKNSKYKFIFLSFSILFTVIIAFLTIDIWIDLIDETTSQVDNDDYNRVKAFYYFVYEANKNEITAIFGNGFLSSKTTSLMQDMMDLGIYNSDLGIIGYWNQFGIISNMVFIIYICKAILSKNAPFFVKAIGLHILGCLMTISYFATLTSIMWYALFYYLYVYHSRPQIISRYKLDTNS